MFPPILVMELRSCCIVDRIWVLGLLLLFADASYDLFYSIGEQKKRGTR